MNKTIANFIVDAVAFAAFVLLAATGVLIKYVLPPGSGHFSALWGMDRHQWGQLHAWIAVALMIALALHLLLHWRWIVCVVKGRPREGSGLRVALAMVGLCALAGLAVAPFLGQVESAGEAPHKMRTGEQPKSLEDQINGSMTLAEVEQRTGVPATVILSELHLPPNVPTDERLGRLRRTYGFDINNVREVVQKHLEQ